MKGSSEVWERFVKSLDDARVKSFSEDMVVENTKSKVMAERMSAEYLMFIYSGGESVMPFPALPDRFGVRL